jgi:two-component system, CitB family, response regulator DctR
MKKIRVLLIEDDPMVCEVNRQFIEQVEGFEIVATAKNGKEGLEKIAHFKPDLVFMDIFMPEVDGIETLTAIRSQYLNVDVITVTAANDFDTVQKCLRLGVCDYIMKPFTFERIEKALNHYGEKKSQLYHSDSFTQAQLDTILYPAAVAETNDVHSDDVFEQLPKGFNKATLLKVLAYLKQAKSGTSADEVAANIGVARVTARRYLDFMEKQQLIHVEIQYGSVGRPINQYYVKQ